MPLQTNLTYQSKATELNTVLNSFWPKTPQQNKFRQIMQEKNSNKKRRHFSEHQPKLQYHNNGLNNKTPTTPNSSFNKPVQSIASPFYAGAKFSEAPLPSFLPKPPVHWIDSNELNSTLNDDLATLAASAKVIEDTIIILEKKNEKLNDKSNENSNVSKHNQTSSSSKYYADNRKAKSESATSGGLLMINNNFQYNFRNTRRNTPQCQTKCKNTRYSSFSRQNIHQKIAAVN